MATGDPRASLASSASVKSESIPNAEASAAPRSHVRGEAARWETLGATKAAAIDSVEASANALVSVRIGAGRAGVETALDNSCRRRRGGESRDTRSIRFKVVMVGVTRRSSVTLFRVWSNL